MSKGHVSNVKKQYETGGVKALKPKRRGRPKGTYRVLTPEQEKEIQGIIVDKTPEQMRFKECMWTRNNIRGLIKEKYGIDIKLSTLGYYLSRWGFSVQRPVQRAYKQDEKKIDKWLNEEFPGITKRAEEENADIFFGDETNTIAQNTPDVQMAGTISNFMKRYKICELLKACNAYKEKGMRSIHGYLSLHSHFVKTIPAQQPEFFPLCRSL